MQQDNPDDSAGTRGENHEFLDLYLQYEQRLYQRALKLSRGPITPEDVVQEAVLKAWTKFETLRNKNCFGAWLSKIVFHTYLQMRDKENAELRQQTAYLEQHLKQQCESETVLREETDSRIDKAASKTPSGPHSGKTTTDTSPVSRPSPDKIHREIIREGLENYTEMNNENDFLPWICKKTEKVYKRMRKNQQMSEQNPNENKNDKQEW